MKGVGEEGIEGGATVAVLLLWAWLGGGDSDGVECLLLVLFPRATRLSRDISSSSSSSSSSSASASMTSWTQWRLLCCWEDTDDGGGE